MSDDNLSINNDPINSNHLKETSIARNVIITICIMMLVTLLSFVFRYIGFEESNIIIAYILGVLLVAKQTDGYSYGFAASVMGVLTFNFFFMEPYYSLEVYRPDYPIAFLIMFTSAIITSTLTTKSIRHGTGLGLSICKSIIHASGGEIRF